MKAVNAEPIGGDADVGEWRFEAVERQANAEMFALVKRMWARYDKDDEPEEGWSEADEDVMSLLGWNHTLFNLSHPSMWDVEARDLIRRSAALIKPQEGETVFYIRVGGENSQTTIHSAKGVEPKAALTAALTALQGECEDLDDCPVHTPPANRDGGEVVRLARKLCGQMLRGEPGNRDETLDRLDAALTGKDGGEAEVKRLRTEREWLERYIEDLWEKSPEHYWLSRISAALAERAQDAGEEHPQ